MTELAVGEQTLVGRITGGDVAALTPAQVLTLLAIAANYQPLDSDLTAIAALTTTTWGRGILAHANVAATWAALSAGAGADVSMNSHKLTSVTDGTAASDAATFGQTYTQAINAQTGTTYTLVAGDVGKLVTLSNGSAITLTVPQDSDASVAVGAWVELFQLGAGQVTVAAGSGATLRATPTAKARAQYSRLFVQKISANTWALAGDISAT